MANDVYIMGTRATAKVRNPWLVLLFNLLTLTVYSWFWWYFVNREMRDLGRTRPRTDQISELGDDPSLSTLAFTLGSIVTIPWIWTTVTTIRRMQAAQRLTVGQSLNGWVAALLYIVTFWVGGMVYLQFELNKVWRAPGMWPVEGDHAVWKQASAQKLADLRTAGALTDAEHLAERERIGVA